MKPPRIKGMMTRGAFQAERTALCSEDERNVGSKHRTGEKQGVWGETGGREARLMMRRPVGHLGILSPEASGQPFRPWFAFVYLFVCLR